MPLYAARILGPAPTGHKLQRVLRLPCALRWQVDARCPVRTVAQRGGESGSADTDESMADVLAWLLKDGASTAGGEQAMSIASLQARVTSSSS